MAIRKWFHLIALVLALIITDQFFKIASRYLTPAHESASSLVVAYHETKGWIDRTDSTPLSQAFKNLLLSQNGIFSALVLVTLLAMFQHSKKTAEPRFVLPYACVVAAILSVWIDNVGVWAPQSLHISWLHVKAPVQLNLSWSEIYLFLGVALFFWRIRRNEVVQ
jgi:hypothetical protein